MPRLNENTKRIDWEDAKNRLAQGQAATEAAFAQDDRRVQEVYRVRAVELASRGQTAKLPSAIARALVVMLGAERYALDIETIVEVLPFAYCTPVPSGPPELVGVVNRRGEVRSVVSLSHLLSLPESADGHRKGGYIAMLRNGALEVGMHVDQVEKIALVALDSSMAPTAEAVAAAESYVRGINVDGLILLNVPALLLHPVLRAKCAPATHTSDH